MKGLVQLVLGLVVGVAGLVMGFASQGACGSVFSQTPQTDSLIGALQGAGCSQTMQTPRILTYGLLLAGVVLLVVGAVRLSQNAESRPQPEG